MAGELEISSLESHICVWRDNGMPDYAHGFDVPMRYERLLVQNKCRGASR